MKPEWDAAGKVIASKDVMKDIIQHQESSDAAQVAEGEIAHSAGNTGFTEADAFYAVHHEQPFYHDRPDLRSAGPSVALLLEREDAISWWRETMGDTNPQNAAPYTLRGKYGVNIEKNSVHGSDAPETAADEQGFFFSRLEQV